MKGFKWKSIVKFVVLCMSICVVSVLISEPTNAIMDITDTPFEGNNFSYRSWGEMGEGAPFVSSTQSLGTRPYGNFPLVILGASDSSIVLRKLYALSVVNPGYNFVNTDSSKRFQSAEAEMYFLVRGASYLDIKTPSAIKGNYYMSDDSFQTVDCTMTFSDVEATSDRTIIISCPRVSNSNYKAYTFITLDIGQTYTTINWNSDYWISFRNGGGVYFSAIPGRYRVSSSDDESLNAIENQTQTIEQGFQDIGNQLEQQQQQEQQDRDDMQNASDDASASGDDSQAQAEATGTTLLKAFTDFVGALTSSTATDCVVNMNMGNLNLGNVDLCSLSIPQPLQAVASIMLIGFCVPLSIATARKLIGLFRSFQG